MVSMTITPHKPVYLGTICGWIKRLNTKPPAAAILPETFHQSRFRLQVLALCSHSRTNSITKVPPRSYLYSNPTRIRLIKRQRLRVKKYPTALRPPELYASEGFHGDAPGEAGQGHNGCTDNRISPGQVS